MAGDYRNTLRAHAYALSFIGKAYTNFASRHRAAASASEKGRKLTFDGHFKEWIYEACEFSAASERLLALEVELARSFGITWEEIAAALGVSRQAAWDRFANQSRWQKSRRVSQLQAAQEAEFWRKARNQMIGSEEETVALKAWLERRQLREKP
jgi:hypothetical protein